MDQITLPTKIILRKEKDNEAEIVIEPCFPGYGTTIGTALRRVLLSSLPGAAITAIKIKGIDHEFSAIEHIKENVIDIILNIKKIQVKSFSDKPIKLKLKHKGKGKILAKNIEKSSDVEIMNPEQHIVEATHKDADFEIDLVIEKGMGYSPVEQRNGKEMEIGMIAIDAVFSPIKAVGYKIENTRVGQRTDFDRLILHVKTNNAIKPLEAIGQCGKILVDQFSVIAGKENLEKKIKESKKKETETSAEKEKVSDKAAEKLISELKLSTRTYNALDKAKIRNIKDLVKKREEDLLELEGFGETALKEIKKELKKIDLSLKKE